MDYLVIFLIAAFGIGSAYLAAIYKLPLNGVIIVGIIIALLAVYGNWKRKKGRK